MIHARAGVKLHIFSRIGGDMIGSGWRGNIISNICSCLEGTQKGKRSTVNRNDGKARPFCCESLRVFGMLQFNRDDDAYQEGRSPMCKSDQTINFSFPSRNRVTNKCMTHFPSRTQWSTLFPLLARHSPVGQKLNHVTTTSFF